MSSNIIPCPNCSFTETRHLAPHECPKCWAQLKKTTVKRKRVPKEEIKTKSTKSVSTVAAKVIMHFPPHHSHFSLCTSAPFIVHIVHSTIHTLLHTASFILHPVHYSNNTLQSRCTLFTAQLTLTSVHCTIHF